MNKSIDEQLHEIKHLLKVLTKGQEDIKSHLWRQPENKLEGLTKEKNREILETEAINYVHNVLIPDLAAKEEQKGDMIAQSAWIEWAAKPVVEYLKAKAMEFIIKTLEELKNQAIPIAIDIADWVLNQLENLLVGQYAKASPEQKQLFKEKVEEKFPNSRLLKKLD